MGHLFCVTGGVFAACLFSAFLPAEAGILLLCLTIFGFFCFLKDRQGEQGKTAGLLSLGALVGILYVLAWNALIFRPLLPFDGQTVKTSVTLTEAVNGEGRAEGVIFLEGRPHRIRIALGDRPDLQPGDILEGAFRLECSESGEDKWISRLRGDGIFLRGYARKDVKYSDGDGFCLLSLPGRLRQWGERILTLTFPNKTAPFAKALLLGKQKALPFSVRWDLRLSGISHLMAVSGLHVSVFCMALSLATFQNRRLTAILGVPVLLLFGAVTGFTPSVTRAVIMMFFLIFANLIGRRYDPLAELSAAVLVMLAINPYTVLSISFQLSCASVLGIAFFCRKIMRQLYIFFRTYGDFRDWLRDWVITTASVSWSSLIFVTPLSLLYFRSISLIAVLTNLLTLWLVPLIFWGILCVLLLSLLSMEAAGILGTLVSLPILWVLNVSHVLSSFPLAAIFTETPVMVLWVILVYRLGFFFFGKTTQEPLYFLRAVSVSFVVALAISWFLPGRNGVTMKVYDVGQGQCILLQAEGRNFLVDCGGDQQEKVASRVLETLFSRGIRHLDGLILTHFDRDHICGADEVTSVLRTEAIYVPQTEGLPEDPRIRQVNGEKTLTFGNTVLTIYGSETHTSSNEMGLCVLLDSPRYDILITGDRSEKGERMLLENHRIPQVDCLIAGHHGAKDSTCRELLHAVKPKTVVISAGRKNRYGHPAGETLGRLSEFGCQVLRTDLDGTITIRRGIHGI